MAASDAPSARRLASTLGGRRALGTNLETLEALRQHLQKGLPYAAFEALRSTYGLDVASLAGVLRIPARTLARRRRARRFRPDESDRLLRVARVVALAEEHLGDSARAARWLKSPNRALGNAVPLEHLDTDLGARQVEDVLGRLAHGVYS